MITAEDKVKARREETIALLKREAPWCRVIVGGAVLNQEYADRIGADYYARDAMETVRIAEEIERGSFAEK